MKKKFGRTDKRDYNVVNIKTYAQILLFEKKKKCNGLKNKTTTVS